MLTADVVCPLCGGKTGLASDNYNNYLYPGNDGVLFDELKLMACNTCCTGFAYPYPSNVDISEFYENRYRNEDNPHSEQLSDFSEKNKYSKRAAAQIMLAKTVGLYGEPVKILDIGAGPGWTLKISKMIYPKSSCYAIEPDVYSQNVLESQGFNVVASSLVDGFLDNASEKFDLIIFSHVLEHFSADKIHDLMSALPNIMNTESAMVIEVPYEGGERVGSWKNNLAPHLVFFSERSLKQILSQYFEVLYCERAGNKLVKKANVTVGEPIRSPSIIHFIKSLLNYLPGGKKIKLAASKIKSKSWVEMLSDPVFDTRRDGNVIRAVVRLKKDSVAN